MPNKTNIKHYLALV